MEITADDYEKFGPHQAFMFNLRSDEKEVQKVKNPVSSRKENANFGSLIINDRSR